MKKMQKGFGKKEREILKKEIDLADPKKDSGIFIIADKTGEKFNLHLFGDGILLISSLLNCVNSLFKTMNIPEEMRAYILETSLYDFEEEQEDEVFLQDLTKEGK